RRWKNPKSTKMLRSKEFCAFRWDSLAQRRACDPIARSGCARARAYGKINVDTVRRSSASPSTVRALLAEARGIMKKIPRLQRPLSEIFHRTRESQSGKIGYLLAALLGIPIPILVVIFLLRGCH